MRVATVGLYAALGMIVTSVAVWSATGPRGPVAPTRAAPARTAPTPAASAAGDLRPSGPSFTAGETLILDARLGHSALLAGRPDTTFVYAAVRPGAARPGARAAPLELSIVLDRSGSMKGARLENALRAARGMLRSLRDGDVVSVVAYDTRTDVVLPPTRVDGATRALVERALDRVEARGDTCISCGLDEALGLLGRAGSVGRILLLSDGEATAGVRDVAGFRAIAARARSRGVPISSVGVDVDYNERVLAALAQDSNGEHHFVENAADLERVFQAELATLVATVARGAELDVELAPGIELVRVHDRAFRQEGSRVVVPLGDVAEGEERSALLEVRVPRGAPGRRAVARIRLVFHERERAERGECSGSLSTDLVDDSARVSPLDGLVAARVARSQTASAILEATELFSGGDVEGATRRLDRHRAAIDALTEKARAGAPPDRKAGVDDDLGRQSAALEKARRNLEQVPRPAPGQAPTASREGKAAPKRNVDFAEPFLK